ncbi:MAG TPA: hypothetical protein VFK47_22700 [Ktedonobacteraceae bacterium]|nr:hypothetical protein [Ktedonobacteraceae bacterium]
MLLDQRDRWRAGILALQIELASSAYVNQAREGAVLTMTKIKVGVVGLGEVAQVIHLPILQAHADQFEIAAICDISQELLSAWENAITSRSNAAISTIRI